MIFVLLKCYDLNSLEITKLFKYQWISILIKTTVLSVIRGERIMLMQITLTKEQIKEVFGELRYMGADYCYRYDKDTRKKTEDIEAVKLHLGSMKLGNSVDIRLEMTEIPTIEPYSVVELDTPVYAPYVQRGNYPTLVERVTCKGIRCISQKNA